MQNRIERLKRMVGEISSAVDEKTRKKLDLDKCERMIVRLNSLTDRCDDCKQNLMELEACITNLHNNIGQYHADSFKDYKALDNQITAHLQKQHKLVPIGTYFAIYMSLGLSIGMVLGMTLFDNIALGMPLGMSLGMGIGVYLDNDAKKKGRTI